jgi:hypothetical protein
VWLAAVGANRVLDNNRFVYTAKSGWEGDGELERWRHVFLAADVSHARPALEGVEGKDALDRHWVPAALSLHPSGLPLPWRATGGA